MKEAQLDKLLTTRIGTVTWHTGLDTLVASFLRSGCPACGSRALSTRSGRGEERFLVGVAFVYMPREKVANGRSNYEHGPLEICQTFLFVHCTPLSPTHHVSTNPFPITVLFNLRQHVRVLEQKVLLITYLIKQKSPISSPMRSSESRVRTSSPNLIALPARK